MHRHAHLGGRDHEISQHIICTHPLCPVPVTLHFHGHELVAQHPISLKMGVGPKHIDYHDVEIHQFLEVEVGQVIGLLKSCVAGESWALQSDQKSENECETNRNGTPAKSDSGWGYQLQSKLPERLMDLQGIAP